MDKSLVPAGRVTAGVTKPSLLQWMRLRLRNRPDSEHEMTINRMVFSGLVIVYMVVGYAFGESHATDMLVYTGLPISIYYLMSIMLFAHILWKPGISPARRVFAIFHDLWMISYAAYTGGETMSFFYPLFLWTILGNGFRFGVNYLWIAMGVSFVGLTLAFVGDGFWARNTGFAVGLLVGVIIVPLYCSTLIRKLSAAKRIAEEASRHKSLFLASISHELRTPLNVIIGVSDLLRGQKFDREQAEMVQMIGTSGRSLLSLINSILDFSRLEAGQMPTQQTTFDLVALLAQVRAQMAVQANAKGLHLGLFVSSAVPGMIEGDRRHIEELLLNLAGNAIKFTADGHVQINVEVAGDRNGKVRLRFEVRDTGIGIAPQAQAHIFNSFTQADETIIDRFGGTGLGLAICRQIVELHGGEIGLESTLGEGSTFWFEIDYAAIAREEVAASRGDSHLLVLSDDLRLLSLGEEFAGETHACGSLEQAEDTLRTLRASKAETIIALVDDQLLGVATTETAENLFAADPKQRLMLIHVATEEKALPADDRFLFTSSIPRPLERVAIGNAVRIALTSESGGLLPEIASGPSAVRRAFNILVAEDNRTNQLIIRKVLERAGHTVTVASNGEAALDALREENFDIVLMDINMPLMNGIEATKLYRFMSVGRERVPIVALTADATPEAQARCADAGMDACLTKPIDSQILFRTLEELVPIAGAPLPVDPDSGVVLLENHPRFQPTSAGGLNLEALNGLLKLGGRSFVQELIDEFTREGKLMLDELHVAVAEDNLHAFGERIHALRSCAANIGAQNVFERCVAWRDITAEELSLRGEDYLRMLKTDFETSVEHLNAFATIELKTGTD